MVHQAPATAPFPPLDHSESPVMTRLDHPIFTPLISGALAVFSLAVAANTGNGFSIVVMLVFVGLMVWSLARARAGRPVPNLYAGIIRAVMREKPSGGDSAVSLVWDRDRELAHEVRTQWVRIAEGWGASWRTEQDVRGRLEKLREPWGQPRMEATTAVPEIVSLRSMNRGLVLEFRVPDGTTVEDFQRTSGRLAAMLGRPVEVSERGVGLVHAVIKTGRDLLAEPVKSGLDGALALTEDGEPYTPEKSHVLVAGATGSGKASIAWGVLFAWMRTEPTVVYGADPKCSEFAFVERMFEAVGTDPESIAAVLATVHAQIGARQGLGRNFRATVEHPRIVLMIDEWPSLFLGMDAKTKKAAEGDLTGILQKGRSRGVVVIGQTQQVTKEVLGNRDALGVRLAGRLETPQDGALLFGNGAADRGIRPDTIPPANDSNGYASAGTFYAVDETGQALRARCPYISDDQLDEVADAIALSRERVRRDEEDAGTEPSAVRSRSSRELDPVDAPTERGDTRPRPEGA